MTMAQGIFQRALANCAESGSQITCLAERAATALDRALDWDMPLVDGISLVRNNRSVSVSSSRGFSGIERLTSAMKNFMESHTLTVDLGEDSEDDDVDDVGEARGDKKDKKEKKKAKKFASYALMVMMGIFGLTGPLILKTLALIAGKALIASKMALLIVGSVALKKLFEKDDKAPSVKVRTVEAKEGSHDDHDRVYYGYNNYDYYYNQNQTPYPAYNYNNRVA